MARHVWAGCRQTGDLSQAKAAPARRRAEGDGGRLSRRGLCVSSRTQKGHVAIQTRCSAPLPRLWHVSLLSGYLFLLVRGSVPFSLHGMCGDVVETDPPATPKLTGATTSGDRASQEGTKLI